MAESARLPTFNWDRAETMRNLVSTMMGHDNFSYTLKDCGIARIARFQGFDPDELRAEFLRQETAQSLSPPKYEEMDK